MRRLLLVLTILLTSKTYAATCSDGTVDGVALCTVEDKITILMQRLYPTQAMKSWDAYNAVDTCVPVVDDPLTTEIDETVECPVWVDPKLNSYTFEPYDDQAPRSMYERLTMTSKPLLSVFETDLAAWKTEETAEIVWSNRVEAVKDKLRERMIKCGVNVPNAAVSKLATHAQLHSRSS